MSETPHRRFNPLTGDWVLVSPHRITRPWQGERAAPRPLATASHDPSCYLCPGNTRSNGDRNPEYRGPWSFPNDFPALLPDPVVPGTAGGADHPLFRADPVAGEARVLCYAPDHSLSLARMDDAQRRAVIDSWCVLSAELGQRWAHVEIFENRGAMMGASSPHPHGQIWASDFVPTLVAREDAGQRDYLARKGRNLLADLVAAELAAAVRVVASNASWIALVPYWAAWPFETLIVARRPVSRLEQLGAVERDDLAQLLGQVLRAGDRLFDTEFPYSLGWHGAPHALADDDGGHWRLHAHIYPPLLRSADIRKHMVGFELLGEIQRDMVPEAAAQRLREAMP